MSGQSNVQDQAAGYPGTRYGLKGHLARSYQNDRGREPQVDTITVTSAVADTDYVFTVDVGDGPISVLYHSSGAPDLAEIRDGLIKVARAIPELSDKVFANVAAAAALSLTSVKAGVPFTTAEADANLTLANTVANVTTQPIPFGRAVVRGTTGSSSVELPSSAGQLLEGLVERVHTNVDPIEGYADEVAPFQDMSIGYQGQWWVRVEQDVLVTDPVFFRHTAGAGGTQLGAWRKDADTATADQVTNARWVQPASAGGLALLSLNLA